MSKAEEYADKFDYDYAECNPRKAVIETYNTGYQQAKQDAREEMLKDAIETTIDGKKTKIIVIDD